MTPQPDQKLDAAEIEREATAAMRGYTVSTEGAVIGQFRGQYFLRSRTHRLTLPVDTTSFGDLVSTWRQFREQAHAECRQHAADPGSGSAD